MLKIGTCGWSSFPANRVIGRDWKEKFKSKLQAYARYFDTVEINSTFYKLPRESTARRWLDEAREVNPRFEFTVKANQEITHRDRFSSEKSLEAWEKTVGIANILGASGILLQTPASFRPTDENVENLAGFLERARKLWNRTIAWEPRGKWLENPELIREISRKFSLIHCVDPFRNEPVTKGRIYWRIHGLGKPSMYNYRFSDEELQWLAGKARKKDGWLFFNNIWMGEDALRFLRFIDQ